MPGKTVVLALCSLYLGLADAASLVAVSRAQSSPQPSRRGEPSEPVNEYAASVDAFRTRIDEYLSLRGEVARKVPEVKETGDPAKISSREQALGQAIASARASARPGDVFGDFKVHVARILREDVAARSPADRKALFHELPAGVELHVNRPYPTTLPLVSVPPSLLAKLPALPEELEYRLVSRHLVLRDRDANLILDVLLDVVRR
jgi:hypothetical protein